MYPYTGVTPNMFLDETFVSMGLPSVLTIACTSSYPGPVQGTHNYVQVINLLHGSSCLNITIQMYFCSVFHV